MASKLSREDDFLLKEYESAIQLTLHVDELRSKFTNLFITIVGATAVAISLLVQGNAKFSVFGKFEILLGLLLLITAFIGFLVVAVIARLRKVQLENFRIANNIRGYFLGTNFSLWNIVELSKKTLPSPNRLSGTYFWLLMLILLNAYIIALTIYLFAAIVWKIVSPNNSFLLASLAAVIFIIVQDFLYFKLATPPKPIHYSSDSSPIGN